MIPRRRPPQSDPMGASSAGPSQAFLDATSVSSYPWAVGSQVPESPAHDVPGSYLAPGAPVPFGAAFDPGNTSGWNSYNIPGKMGESTIYTPRGGTPGYYDPAAAYEMAPHVGSQGGMFYIGDRYDDNGVFRPFYSSQTMNFNPFTANAPGTYDPEKGAI